MKLCVFSFLLLTFSLRINAQHVQVDKDYYEFLLDEIVNETEDENAALEILQQLEEKLQNPLNLNLARTEDLNELYILSEFQIFSILEFRRKYGPFLSLNELRLIPGLHEETIRLILPLISLNNKSGRIIIESDYKPSYRHKLLLRTGLSYPYKEGFWEEQDSLQAFYGNPLSALIKYEIERKGILRAGLTLENDPGENLSFEKNKNGFDFLSAYLEINEKGPFQKIILGDYRLITGSGLVHGYGRINKSSAIHLKQTSNNIKKYSSGAEYGFKRGLATKLGIRNFSALLFVSMVKIDAGFVAYEEDPAINTIIKSGLHRNQKELENKNNTKQINWGGTLIFESSHIDVGYNFSNTKFDKKLKYRILPDRYSKSSYDNNFIEQSLFYALRYGNLMAGGELAMDDSRHIANIHNLQAQLHPLVSLQLSYRNYHPSYLAFDASSLTESGGISNEKGFYAGSIFYPSRFLKVSLYTDRYHFPWYKYASNMPYYGKDYLIKADFIFNPELDMFIMLKKEISFQNDESENVSIKKMEEQVSRRMVFQTKFSFSEKLSLRTKIELKTSLESRQKWQGSFMAQDVNLRIFQNRLTINTRYALFDVPDWSVRIYAWESDVFSAFSSPLFYHRGMRANIVVKFNFVEKLDLWIKYAQTRYTSEVTSGNGPDLRTGQCFREMKIQMNVKF